MRTVIDGWEFETTRKRARAYHDHVGRLNGQAREQLDEAIYGRLKRRSDAPDAPQGHWKLADEIVALLDDPHLSEHQTQELEDAYFRHRQSVVLGETEAGTLLVVDEQRRTVQRGSGRRVE